MSSNAQLSPIDIPFRKIICKSCQTVGSTEMGFKIFESEIKDRAMAVCDSCGATNLIKKERA